MGEYCAVLLLPVGEAEHTAHIHLELPEIRIQAISADLLTIEIMICGFRDLTDLIFLSRAAHNRKYLSGEHHPHIFVTLRVLLYTISMIIIVAVEPAFALGTVDPLLPAKKILLPCSHLPKGIHDLIDGKFGLFPGYISQTAVTVGL